MNGIINSSLEDTLNGSALWHGLVSCSTVDFNGHGRCGRRERGALFLISCCAWDGSVGSRQSLMCGAGL